MSIFKAILGICDTKPLSGNLWSLEENRVRVKLSQIPEPLVKGDTVYLKGVGLVKRRKIDPIPGEEKLRCCSIGHSEFDLEGNVIKGRAKDKLKQYAGYFLPGVWGCPPAQKVPQGWGTWELIEVIPVTPI
jgi:hypothetical protein